MKRTFRLAAVNSLLTGAHSVLRAVLPVLVATVLVEAASAHGGVSYTVTALGNLGDDGDTRAWALNDSGQVVGWSRTSSRITHAFLWDAATGMRDLGALLPEGVESKALGINNSGRVVGHWWGSDFVAHAFLYDPATGMANLPGLVAGGWSYAYAINNAGQIIGWAASFAAADGPRLWFLYDGTTVWDVRDLVPAGVRSMGVPPSTTTPLGSLCSSVTTTEGR